MIRRTATTLAKLGRRLRVSGMAPAARRLIQTSLGSSPSIALLFAVATALTLRLAWEVATAQPYRIDLSPDGEASRPRGAPEARPRDAGDYRRVIARKGLFVPLEEPAPPKPEPVRTKPRIPISELVSKLELMGIVGGDHPQAVIRDRDAGNMYYLSEGQKIGELIIKTIRPRSVVLTHEDEEIEIVI